MEEDTLLVCRKTGKTGEDSNGDNSNEYLLLLTYIPETYGASRGTVEKDQFGLLGTAG